MINLNLLFNKSYFNVLKSNTNDPIDDMKTCNRKICDAIFRETDYNPLPEGICNARFFMKTTYPGLLVGTGYAHETEDGSDDCVKLGFSFDYVTGQPYIPGSSVKGMLRSCFKEGVAGEVLQGLLGSADAPSPKALKALEKNIFGGRDADEQEDDGQESDGQDIFFDAVLRCGSRISDPNGREKGNVMALDYITPHGKDPTKPNGRDETKSPTPLLMVKVRPGVIFEFRFKLHDFKTEGLTVTADQKKALFQILIELFGVGAKTNVGYGALLPTDETEARQHLTQTGTQTKRNQNTVQQQGAGRDAVQSRRQQPQHTDVVYESSASDSTQKPKKQYCCGCKEKKNKKVEIGIGEVLCPDCLKAARKDHICAVCKKPTMSKQPSDQGYDLFCTEHWRTYCLK